MKIEKETGKFLFLATALLAGTVYFFTQLSEKVDALEKENISQGLALAGANQQIKFLESEKLKINTDHKELQGKLDAIKDRVLILEQKKL